MTCSHKFYPVNKFDYQSVDTDCNALPHGRGSTQADVVPGQPEKFHRHVLPCKWRNRCISRQPDILVISDINTYASLKTKKLCRNISCWHSYRVLAVLCEEWKKLLTQGTNGKQRPSGWPLHHTVTASIKPFVVKIPAGWLAGSQQWHFTLDLLSACHMAVKSRLHVGMTYWSAWTEVSWRRTYEAK